MISGKLTNATVAGALAAALIAVTAAGPAEARRGRGHDDHYYSQESDHHQYRHSGHRRLSVCFTPSGRFVYNWRRHHRHGEHYGRHREHGSRHH
ncbi:MAG: hypothetical protein ABL907_07565 [Hyphomicrobium sp.]